MQLIRQSQASWVAVALVGGLLAASAALGWNNGDTNRAADAVVKSEIQLCQCTASDCGLTGGPSCNPASPFPIWAVDSAAGGCLGEVGWDARSLAVPWQTYAQGEYLGHARTPHVPEYRVRVGDQLALYFLRTRRVIGSAYQLQVGDTIRVESLTADSGTAAAGSAATSGELNRDLVVQPDGTITLPLLGQIRAAGLSIPDLRSDLAERAKKYYKNASITVTAVKIDTRLEDFLQTVDSRFGAGGLQLRMTVTPAGRINLPALGSVYVQGLTLSEIKLELDARFNERMPGVEVTVDLVQRAQRFAYVLGEVNQPGRFTLEGPTTLSMALALAGSWKQGANLRQVVVFRRGDDWRLLATMVDVRGALYARRPVPADEIWLNDSDIVLVPKTWLQQADEIIDQVFVRGLYSVVPQDVIWNTNIGSGSSL